MIVENVDVTTGEDVSTVYVDITCRLHAEEAPEAPEAPDARCQTLPNGSCVAPNTCMHTPQDADLRSLLSRARRGSARVVTHTSVQVATELDNADVRELREWLNDARVVTTPEGTRLYPASPRPIPDAVAALLLEMVR